jgi:trk system potassium uptake protein TrkH
MAVILLLEWGHAFRAMGIKERLLAAFFQSVTCRTAGFNTVDIGSLRQATQFIMIILMFIGGSPGSIAGGVKTTTFGVLTMMLIAKFKGAAQVVIGGRAIENGAVERSTMLVSISMIFVLCSTFMLLVMNSFDMRCSALAAAFETVSAFGTVGLSMGITTQLSTAGKLLLCAVMYVGRLGALTLITALTINKKEVNIEYPEDHIMIG